MWLAIVLFKILLPLLVLAGIFGYFYLRQEEAKLFPKSVYDEARDEIYKRKYRWFEPYREAGWRIALRLGAILRPFFSTQFALLLITFGVALIVTLVPVSVIEFNIEAVILFPFMVLSLPLFPTGLFEFLNNTLHYPLNSSFDSYFEIIAGWLIYIVVFTLGAFAKKRSAFILVYLIFITLLMMNVAGCIQSATPFCPNGPC